VGEVERVTEALGDVLERMGDYEKAAEAYRRARRCAGDDPVSAARLLLKQARVQAWLRRYSQALGLITRGLRGLKDLKTNAARAQRAQLMVWYGHFRQEQGRHDEAMSWSRRAIEEAEAAGDRDALAHAYRLLDWVYADRGEFEKATNSRHALALYEQLGDLPSQASVLNNMGGLAYWQGDWASALDFYERAYELDERTGDVVGAALDQDNIGEILIDQGRIEDAEKLLRAADRVMRAAGHRSGVAFVTKNLGRAAARAGRFDAAHDLLERALAGWEAIGAEVQAVEATARIAELHVMQGHADEALALADAALEHATVREGVAAQSPLIYRIRAYALMQRHQLPEARASLEESLRAAQAREADYEIALTQRALGELARLQGDEPPRALVEASQAVFNRLGVEELPSVPLPVSGAAAAQS
jgi:tetratricopeptide (TPR) repeat protein